MVDGKLPAEEVVSPFLNKRRPLLQTGADGVFLRCWSGLSKHETSRSDGKSP